MKDWIQVVCSTQNQLLNTYGGYRINGVGSGSSLLQRPYFEERGVLWLWLVEGGGVVVVVYNVV